MTRRSDLVKAINNYDIDNDDSFFNLRDVICRISDEGASNDPMIEELLFMAAQKLRVFGYNRMNKLDLNSTVHNEQSKNIADIIQEFYQSTSGKILDFQQKEALDLFESGEDKKRLFLSAPTAFGKTFILQEIILANNYNTILLIFPTISLLNENTNSIQELVSNNNLDYEVLNATRQLDQSLNRKILLLTPERVLKLMLLHPNMNVDFFFMDEVYKVDNFFDTSDEDSSEDDRDKVFRVVLYKLSKIVRNFYLAGPYINTSNMGQGFRKFIEESEVDVYEVDRELVSKTHIPSWRRSLVINGVSHSLPASKPERLQVVLSLIKELQLGKTLVYMATRDKVDKAAREMIDGTELPRDSPDSDRLAVFINHLRGRYGFIYQDEDIAENWALVEMLKRRLGQHHGSLPKYIQEEVLDLFNGSELDTIISTTSITEGVNTNAKNVIFHGATKGGKQLKVFDVKNINGRAGRYHHNFVGRIFYLEKSVKDIIDERNDESLDFLTFSDKVLDGVDLDNALSEDLTQANAARKNERQELIDNSGIPEDVFVKNQLTDRLQQIEIVQRLRQMSDLELRVKISNYSTLKRFLEGRELLPILELFSEVGAVDTVLPRIHAAICHTYTSQGFAGMLAYEVKVKREKLERPLVSGDYDSCYRAVFSKIRNVIEFAVPKQIAVYSHLFEYVARERGFNFSADSFDKVISFFELGVNSSAGIVLAEKGFPIAAIKDMERSYQALMQDFETFKSYVNAGGEEARRIERILDPFEIDLLRRYLK